MFRKILIAFGVVAGLVIVLLSGFAVVVALQPAEYRITRSATMAAPPAEVFAQVNDLHNWQAWSPWAKLDPNAENTFEGPPAGTGAILRWSGNDEVGAGRMTIIESRPHERIRFDLEFIRPMEDSCVTEFAFEPEGEQTKVTWTMSGENNFVEKAFCLLMDLDAMVGGDFEKGLASIKSIVEAGGGDKGEG